MADASVDTAGKVLASAGMNWAGLGQSALGAMSGGPSSAGSSSGTELFGGGLNFSKSINFGGTQSTSSGGGLSLPADLPWPLLLGAVALVLVWRRKKN